jgi:transcriptional regulator with XRE-family HTH domain
MNARHVFGENLRRLRQERGLTQETLAFEAGLHRNYIGGIERGERNVALDNIVKLAATLGVEVAALFEGVELGHSGTEE